MFAASPYFGDEKIWDAQTSPHSLYYDEKARVWFAARIRPPANPDFCKKGSDHPSAKVFPLETFGPPDSPCMIRSRKKFTMINTCFPTHHLQFGFDANNTLWASAGGPQSGAAGWLNVKMFEETGDEVKSQGWTPFILDTNGNGKRDEYTEPNQPLDPNKDRRINVAFYGVAPSPIDGTVWGSSLGYPRLRGPARSDEAQSVRDRARGSLRDTGAGLRSARHGYRQPERRVGPALERPYGRVRPPQVQGPQRADDRDRPALSGRLDALSAPGTEAHGRPRQRIGRGELLHLGRPARHAWARQGRAVCHRQSRTTRSSR